MHVIVDCVFRAVPPANQERTEPRTDAPQNGPIFTSWSLRLCYNPEGRYLPIRKNVHFISRLLPRHYKKPEIYERFQ